MLVTKTYTAIKLAAVRKKQHKANFIENIQNKKFYIFFNRTPSKIDLGAKLRLFTKNLQSRDRKYNNK